jgi:hypothetical protein
MSLRLLATLAVAALSTPSAHAETLTIDHAAVACVVAEKFPHLEARFAPFDAVAKAKVLFQSEGARHWYAVAMKPDGALYSGVLPRPTRNLKAFRYYIEATDKAMGISRTAEYLANVVDGPAACRGGMMAGALGSAAVALEIPAGAPAIPVGFGSSGVSASAAAGGGASASAGGGGIPTGVLVGGGLAAAGAAVAVVATRGGSLYTGTFEGEMTITQTPGALTCTWTRSIRGSMNIDLEQSGGSVSGSGHGEATVTITARTGACGGDGPGLGDGGIDGPITGTTSSFMFGTPPALNPSAGQGECGGGRLFVGSLNGDVITGTLTYTAFCVGNSPARGEATIPVTLRR